MDYLPNMQLVFKLEKALLQEFRLYVALFLATEALHVGKMSRHPAYSYRGLTFLSKNHSLRL
jgi:sulfur relay (sulfurtransferase) complex TusBCD TusD component (DsrE family)